MPRPSTTPKVACDQRSRALRQCEHDARYVGEHASDVPRVVRPWRPEWSGTRRSLVERRLLQDIHEKVMSNVEDFLQTHGEQSNLQISGHFLGGSIVGLWADN
ncbi:Isoleucine--tRNA ligase [Gossypium arboreum]|uniref:Isoleucine--tRNA ligase n=1 Tax=Gossypium arboreum TaxID=29729 RepID=A0A0B0MR39_GOSAR|nr:Isoleucine--tRNA ligase [Gossypium arboreum]KHG22263.1 Isoleucine--tRNA ligase [Gossypium arboreum]